MAILNKGLQKSMLKKQLRQKGVDPQGVDLQARVDPQRSFQENREALENKLGNLGRRNRTSEQDRARAEQRKQARREARRIHQERPAFNRFVDETKQAETVFVNPSEKEFEMWARNPDKFDIKGVDTRQSAEERPEVKLPFMKDKGSGNGGGGVDVPSAEVGEVLVEGGKVL